jgi:hypothetical protein
VTEDLGDAPRGSKFPPLADYGLPEALTHLALIDTVGRWIEAEGAAAEQGHRVTWKLEAR